MKIVKDNKEKVWIEPGCIACGSCQFICPEVFKVTLKSAIKSTADLEKHKELIIEAAKKCPVQVIKLKELT